MVLAERGLFFLREGTKICPSLFTAGGTKVSKYATPTARDHGDDVPSQASMQACRSGRDRPANL
jgi:hypothetical protein